MKKAMYFTLEAIIATLIISVGFGVILYLLVTPAQPPLHTTQTALTDTAAVFLLPVGTLDSGTCSPSGSAVTEGYITDLSISFFQQLGEFYAQSKTECTEAEISAGICVSYELLTTCLTEFITEMNLDERNMEVSLDGTVYYTSAGLAEEEATVILPYAVLLTGTYTKDDTIVFWGPYEGEIKVWE